MLTVIIFSLLGGVISLLGGLFLLRGEKDARKFAEYATPFAAGALLAAAFYDLLKDGIHEAGAERAGDVLLASLAGMLLFFFLERFLRWFHHHHEHGAKERASSSLIIIGDTLHNALDGVAIAAAFLIDPSTGVIATIAVAAHEIPQEIGDFSLLLRNGMKRGKVLLVNVLSALATTVTAMITYAIGDADILPLPILLGLTAGFFIYIAASDIIPEIHDSTHNRLTDVRPYLLLLGALVVLAATPVAHRYIEAGHDEASHSEIQHAEEEVHSDE